MVEQEKNSEEVFKNLGNLDFENLTKIQEETYDILIHRFADNIDFFSSYNSKIANLFRNYSPKRSLEFFCVTKGVANLVFPDTNEFFYKAIDPVDLCKHQVASFLNNTFIDFKRKTEQKDPYGQIAYKYLNQSINISNTYNGFKERYCLDELEFIPNIIILGAGLGYQIEELFKIKQIKNCIIIEPNPDVFFASLHTFKWKKFIEFTNKNNIGLEIHVGTDIDQLTLTIQDFYLKRGSYIQKFNPLFTHYQSKEISYLEDFIINNYQYIGDKIGFFDDYLFGISHMLHSVEKGRHFVLKGKTNNYRKSPVFVIASGPSLDADIDFLKKNQDKAIIVACGTAIDILYHVGIKPDFYANTERVPEIEKTLSLIPDKSFFDDIILTCSAVCHPNTVNLFKNTAIFFKANEACYFYLLKNVFNTNNYQYIQLETPLVGNAGVACPIYMGFNHLYLFGIDNGKKMGIGSIHSEYTTLYKKRGYSEDVDEYKTTLKVPGNFGGEVYTNSLYQSSAVNIGIALALENTNGNPISCTNCSDGIYIENTVSKHSNELDSCFATLPVINKKDFRAYITDEMTKPFKLNPSEINKMLSISDFNKLCSEITSLLDRGFSTKDELFSILENISQLLSGKSAFGVYYADLLRGSVESIFEVASQVFFINSDTWKLIADKQINLLRMFLSEAQELFQKLPDYIMGNHKKYFKDGKVGRDMGEYTAPKVPEDIILTPVKFDDPQRKFEKQYN